MALSILPILRNNLYSFLLLLVVTYFMTNSIRDYFLRRKMPPGPTGIPILGNALQMPKQLPWIRFMEFAKQYGPVISFNAAGHPVVVLNDHKSAFELLGKFCNISFDRRSAIYSHRPRFIMAGELLSGGIMLSFIPYGSLFRRYRRASHETFGSRSAEQFQPLQEREAVLVASEILQNPDAWEVSIKRSTASNILTATYGWPRIDDKHIPLINRIHAHTEHLSNACIPGYSLVDLFPFMNYLPTWMSKWKRDALAWHKRESQMFEGFYSDASCEVRQCFVSSLIENEEKIGISKKEAAWLAGIMFSAGAETTSASLANFLIAMIHYPEVACKAQAEIDMVVGRSRLPSFSDRPHLPYIRALVKELLRWRPAGPMGIPRRTAEDDWYNGYFIPKGATVISNIWAINRDPSIYSDPEEFRPERFLDETREADTSPPDMHNLGHSSFGFGRRTCVGATFTNQSLFIGFAVLLWAFNIEKARDIEGNEIMPSLTDVIDAGVTVGPAPFKCKIIPRFENVREVLDRSKANH